MEIKTTGQTAATPSAVGDAAKQDAKLKVACTEMEAVFLNLLMTQMRRTVPKTNLLGGGGNADEIMKSMLDGEMTKNMAKAGGIGLADMLYRQLSPNANKTVNKGQAPK
jgi:flagellar protein FlgJ